MEKAARSSTGRYFHRKLFFYTFCIVVLGAVCGGVGIFALFPSSLGEGYGKALLTIQRMEQALLVKIVWLYVGMAIFFIPAIAFLLMFYSHRIAGPAFRLAREAELIGRGDLKANFQLRQKDNLTDIEDSLKHVAVRYRDTISTLKDQTTAMETQAESIAGMVQQGKDRVAIESALDGLSGTVKNIDRILSEIRTC
jgi:methyl-accepting chemotaxis protein